MTTALVLMLTIMLPWPASHPGADLPSARQLLPEAPPYRTGDPCVFYWFHAAATARRIDDRTIAIDQLRQAGFAEVADVLRRANGQDLELLEFLLLRLRSATAKTRV